MILDGVKQYWQDKSNILELDQEWSRMGETRILSAVLSLWLHIPIDKSRDIVEIGCGTGRIIDLIEEFSVYHACDQSQLMLDICKSKHPGDERISYHQGQIGEMGVPNSDVLLCIEVLQHQADPIKDLEWLLSVGAPYTIVTLAVSDPPKTIDLNGKPGTRTVSKYDIPSRPNDKAIIIQHDEEMSTWIILYENLP